MKQRKAMSKAEPGEPCGLHPLVAARMEQAWANGDGEFALRMLRIESALYIAAEQCGHGVGQGRITVEGQEIALELHPRPRHAYVPRKLTLKARSIECNPVRSWHDKAGEPLEARMEEISAGLKELADEIAEAIVEQAQAEARFEQELKDAARRFEKRRERSAQKARLRDFASNWIEAENIRAFLNALEERLASAPSPPPALSDWLAWARDYAERFDPLSDRGTAKIQWHAEAVAYEPIDDREADPEEGEWRSFGWFDRYITPEPK